MMQILEFFRPKPYERETVARLRDQTIELGTRVLLLEDIVQHSRKPVRESRSDKATIIAAKAAMTAQLTSELKRTAR